MAIGTIAVAVFAIWGAWFLATTLDFDGFVGPNESVRYHLQVVADDFSSSHWTPFEVSWDGTWNENLNTMQTHMRIKKL